MKAYSGERFHILSAARGDVEEEVDHGEVTLVYATSRRTLVAGRFKPLDELKGE